MAEFNEDDSDIEDEADGEHMTQIYSRDSKSEFKNHYVNLTNEKV